MNWYSGKEFDKAPPDDGKILTAGLNVVLIRPEIAPNAGNISRLCFATGTRLHIVGKTGFTITDKHFKRAAVDYWDRLDISYYADMGELLEKASSEGGDSRFIYTTTNGKTLFFDFEYKKGDYIVFGPESTGLDEQMIDSNYDMTVRIPLNSNVRCLNLSTSCGIILFHAIYQLNLLSK